MSTIITLIEALHKNNVWEKKFTLEKGEHLTKEGDIETSIYWVEKGCIRVFYLDSEKEHSIRFGYQNSIITALDSFITNTPTSFYMEAAKRTTVWKVSKQKYLDFIRSKPQHLVWWEELLQGLIHQQLEREIDLLTTSPDERYARVLERSPQLFQEVPLKYFASYLRMTPETLSRIRKS